MLSKPSMKERNQRIAPLLLSLAFPFSLCVGQQAPAPAGQQVQAITAAVNAAQTTINLMPPGAEREAAQQCLANFLVMSAAGKVGIAPRPGAGATGGAGANPFGAWTAPEFSVGSGQGGGGGSGKMGSTPDVGGGGERIELGGFPEGQAPIKPNGDASGSLTGDQDGSPTSAPEVAGWIIIHEGIRCGQAWTRDFGDTLETLDPAECFEYWDNEYQAYAAAVSYFKALVDDAEARGHAGDVAFFTAQMKSRQKRRAEAFIKRAQCGN